MLKNILKYKLINNQIYYSLTCKTTVRNNVTRKLLLCHPKNLLHTQNTIRKENQNFLNNKHIYNDILDNADEEAFNNINQSCDREPEEEIDDLRYDTCTFNMKEERLKIQTNRDYTTKYVCKLFGCTVKEADQKIKSDERFLKININEINKTIELLTKHNINRSLIFKDIWILLIPTNRLRRKIDILHTYQGKQITDFIPFLKLTISQLFIIQKCMNNESDFFEEGNRIYYMSNKLKVDPYTVSKYFSTHLFVFNVSASNLCRITELLLKYNVSGMNIVRDLWTFKYSIQTIESRLERAKVAKKDKIMPWMVRCRENVLERSLKLNIAKLNTIGKNETLAEYLSKRLNYDIDTTKIIIDRHPSILKVRITKIKEILDFLLNDAGFTPLDIAQVPRIFCHSLDTTKLRLLELKSHDCVPSSLVILCRSKTEYEKFLNNWLEVRKKREEYQRQIKT